MHKITIIKSESEHEIITNNTINYHYDEEPYDNDYFYYL